MQPKKSDTDIASELHSIFSSQEEAPYFAITSPHGEARYEDAELSSFEALIEAMLSGDTER